MDKDDIVVGVLIETGVQLANPDLRVPLTLVRKWFCNKDVVRRLQRTLASFWAKPSVGSK